MKGKKGMLGLNTVGVVMLALLTLGVLAIATMSILTPMLSAVDSIETLQGGAVNETLSGVTEVGVALAANTLRNPVCTVTNCINATANVIIASPNRTETNCLVKYSGGAAARDAFNGSTWKCSYYYTYDRNDTNTIVNTDMGKGLAGFFNNVPTFFILLGVIVLILLIAIVIVAVQRFGVRGEL